MIECLGLDVRAEYSRKLAMIRQKIENALLSRFEDSGEKITKPFANEQCVTPLARSANV